MRVPQSQRRTYRAISAASAPLLSRSWNRGARGGLTHLRVERVAALAGRSEQSRAGLSELRTTDHPPVAVPSLAAEPGYLVEVSYSRLCSDHDHVSARKRRLLWNMVINYLFPFFSRISYFHFLLLHWLPFAALLSCTWGT